MISFDEAFELVRSQARPISTERIALADAAGRVLSEAIQARVASPPATVAAMDGFAVRQADLDAGLRDLRIIGESFAGDPENMSIGSGECVRIFTGAPLPDGADRVIIQEVVTRRGTVAQITGPLSAGRHVRSQGSDFVAGETVLCAGRVLDPRALVAAAAADAGHMWVWRRPRISIVSTGDELVAPGEARGRPGAIPDSVSPGVAALAASWGAEIVARHRLGDEPKALAAAAAEALAGSDLVVVTGGASVGERDHAKTMFSALDLRLLFAKVAVKPGKPVWFGRAQGKLVLGLPGNPTAALVTARLLVAPLVCGLAGRSPAEACRWHRRPLATAIEACGDRETFIRGRRNGETIQPLQRQGSDDQKALATADVLIRRRASAPAAHPGDIVEFLDF